MSQAQEFDPEPFNLGFPIWQAKAECLGACAPQPPIIDGLPNPDKPQNIFFPVSEFGESNSHVDKAKAFCGKCVVRQECLDYALSDPKIKGIWGGQTEKERNITLAKRRQEQARRLL